MTDSSIRELSASVIMLGATVVWSALAPLVRDARQDRGQFLGAPDGHGLALSAVASVIRSDAYATTV